VTLLPTVLAPAAGEAATFVTAGVFVAAFLVIHLLIGSVDIFAKLGANQRLKPNLNGSSALVIAYAVATLIIVSIISSHTTKYRSSDSLDQQPHTILTSRPPLRQPLSILLFLKPFSISISNPSFTSEISSEFLNSLFDPVAL
jgi:heme/copper-type cytochrome/quinol oxidase subunit 2